MDSTSTSARSNSRSNSKSPKIISKSSSKNSIQTSPKIGKELCEYCFDIMHARWNNQKYPPLPSGYDPHLKTALFVTFNEFYPAYAAPARGIFSWGNAFGANGGNGNGNGHEADGSNGNGDSNGSGHTEREERLRGCIGCLDANALTLHPGLQNYCISAAFKDGRFSPIRKEEVLNLTCQVSLLHTYETADHSYDWEVGKHGVIVDFWDASGKEYSATYLPEIALECGMTRERAIFELCRKAGYNGSVDESITCNANMKVTKYQSTKVKITGADYFAMKGW